MPGPEIDIDTLESARRACLEAAADRMREFLKDGNCIDYDTANDYDAAAQRIGAFLQSQKSKKK